jgi:hypothetical protein
MQGEEVPKAGLTAISRGVSFATDRPILKRRAGLWRFSSQLIVVVLYQDRTTINDNCLPSSESFLH